MGANFNLLDTALGDRVLNSAAIGAIIAADPSGFATEFAAIMAAPPPVGSTTPNTGAFTTLSATGVFSAANGTVSLPAITFASDTDTGIYRIGANSLGIAANGVVQLTITTAGFNGVLGGTTPAAASVTTLTATGAVALSPANLNVVLSPTGTGVVTINPATAGTVNNVVIGGSTPLAGTFTTGTTTGLATLGSAKVDTGTKTAAATTGAATLNKNSGVITSEALTTAAGTAYTLTLTNSVIAATDQIMASVGLGTATTGVPVVSSVKPGAGSATIVVQNVDLAAALNGTITIAFVVFKA